MEQDISRLCRNNLPLTHCTTTKQPMLTSELWKSITKDDAVDTIRSAPCIEGDSLETNEHILVSDLPLKINVTEPHTVSPSESNKNGNTFVSYLDVNQRTNTEREYGLIDSFQEQKTLADIWNTNTKRNSLYLSQFSEKIQGDTENTRKLIDYSSSQNELNFYLEPDTNISYQKETQNISSHVSPHTMIYSLWETPGHKQDSCTSMTDLCPWVYNQSQYTPWDSFLNGSSVLDSEVKNDNQIRSTGGNRSQDIVSSRSFPMCRAPGSVQVPNSLLAQGNQPSDLVMLMEELALNESFKFEHENDKPLFTQHTLQKPDGASTLVKGCVFCKNNNYHSTFYRSHTLKDERGHCQCPVLRAYVCPLCNATGDAAHTLKYCPRNTVTRGDPISAGLPPGKVTNWREMANRMMHRCRKRP